MLLAIDTATRFLSVALHNGQRILAEKSQVSENQHTTQLIPLIDNLLTDIERTIQDVSAVAVSQGPGSFSGLRVGIGVAKGIASGRNIPLLGIPTLDIVAYSTPPLQATMTAVVQAGRGRIIAGMYRWQGSEWQPEGRPQITHWEHWLESAPPHSLINGEIHEMDKTRLKNFQTLNPAWQVRRAGFLAEIGWKKLLEGVITNPAEVNPIYLKEPG